MNSLILLRNSLNLLKISSKSCGPKLNLKHISFSHLAKSKSIKNNSNAVAESTSVSQIQKKYRESFNCVYEFRFIKHVRLLNRFKIYQTIFAVGTGIYSLIAIDDVKSVLVLNGAMFLALIMLFVISRQTIRVVGRIYISDDKTRVLISHLDFFGKRRDFEVNISEIEPLASFGELKEPYFYLKLKDTDGSMIVSVPYGKIHDKNGFLKIFGIE